MPLYDYECPSCGIIPDVFAGINDDTTTCPHCGAESRRIVSISGQYCGNQDATWLKSVLDVVDKSSRKPHVRAFVDNPTRENYKRWMKGEGIVPADHKVHGGPPVYQKPPDPDMTSVNKEVWEKHRARKRIELR